MNRKLISKVTDSMENTVLEQSFYDENGKIVGHWVTGSFDPFLPYQGQSDWNEKRSYYYFKNWILLKKYKIHMLKAILFPKYYRKKRDKIFNNIIEKS